MKNKLKAIWIILTLVFVLSFLGMSGVLFALVFV